MSGLDDVGRSGAPNGWVTAVAGWLERWLLVAVIAVTAAAVALPGPGRWADRHNGINIALVVLVVASALGIPSGSARALRRLAPRLGIIVALVSVILPLLADGLSHLLGAGPLRHGVLAVGVAPAEVASIGLSGLAGGDVAVAATLLGASTLVSVLTAGPILSLLAGAGVSPGHVVVQLALVVGLPLIVGLLARPLVASDASSDSALTPGHLFAEPGPELSSGPAGRGAAGGGAAGGGAVTDRAGRWRRPYLTTAALGLVATVAVLVLVALVAAQVHLASAYLTVTGVLIALILISAAGGSLLGRLLPRPAARSALLHVSMRDFAIASGIASAAFGAQATGPLGIYGVLVIAWGTLVATISVRSSRHAGAPDDPTPGGAPGS